jgi:hypothetical protein
MDVPPIKLPAPCRTEHGEEKLVRKAMNWICPLIQSRTLDGEIGAAVVEFYGVARAISSEGFDTGLQDLLSGLDTARPGTEVIAAIAEHLTRQISGLEADVLRKAIQETLLDAAGLDYHPELLNLKVELEEFLRKHGAKKILELVLSSYIFNAIWIRIQEAVRLEMGSHGLRNQMIGIERLCGSVVHSVLEEWKADGKLEELAIRRALGVALVKSIQTRLLERAAHL